MPVAGLDIGSRTTKAVIIMSTVKLETSKGDIVIELNEEKAPVTVKNFLNYVNDGFYDGTIFHRVIPNFMIQGGGFNDQMMQKTTRDPIKNEANNGLANDRGTIAMARKGGMANSATCQFFINTVDNRGLDVPRDGAGYAVFGRVIEGMDVIDKIRVVETTTVGGHLVEQAGRKKMVGGRPDVPVEPVFIVTVERIAKPKP